MGLAPHPRPRVLDCGEIPAGGETVTKIFYPSLNREVMCDAQGKVFAGGAIDVMFIAFPEKLITPDEAGDLIREQVAALREFADMFEAQLPKMQNMKDG
jgi:hypothetical protein